MLKRARGFWGKRVSFLVVMVLLTSLMPPGLAAAEEGTQTGGEAGKEIVVFEDNFQRSDSESVGSDWEEYLYRTGMGHATRGETPWSVRGGTLYFEAKGDKVGMGGLIGDFVQTAQQFPVNNTRVEFEIRAKSKTEWQCLGPNAFWVPEPSYRWGLEDPRIGPDFIGVQAAYHGGIGRSRGLYIFSRGTNNDTPQAAFAGLNESGFAKHVIIIKDGKITYQSDSCGPLTYNISVPLYKGAKRHFSFGARLSELDHEPQIIEIRNFKIIDLNGENDFEEKLGEEIDKVVDDIQKIVLAEMEPLVTKLNALVKPKIKDISPRVSALVISTVKPQIMEDVKTENDKIQARVQQIVEEVKGQMMSQMQGGGGTVGGPTAGIPGMGGPPAGIFGMGGFPGIPGMSGPPAGIPGMGGGSSGGAVMSEASQKIRAEIETRIKVAIKEIQQESEAARAEKQKQLQASLRPKVQAIVKAELDPLTPQVQKLIQPEIKQIVAKVVPMVDARINPIIERLRPVMPQELKNLPEQQLRAKLHGEIEADVRPQIEAAINEEVSSLVERKIVSPIEGEAKQEAAEMMETMKTQVMASIQSIVSAGIPKEASPGMVAGEIQSDQRMNIGNKDELIQIELKDSVESKGQNMSNILREFTRKEVLAALTGKLIGTSAPAKKVLKKKIQLRKRR